MVGPFVEFNEDQYVVLINDKLKEYMIVYSYHLENEFEDSIFKYIMEEEIDKLINQLKSLSEQNYYSEWDDLDD